MRRWFPVAGITLILALASGCTGLDPGPATERQAATPNAGHYDVPISVPGKGGYGLSVNILDQNGQTFVQPVLDSPQAPSVATYILNGFPKQHELGLLLLVNGRQAQFSVDGAKPTDLHFFRADSNEMVQLPIKLPLLPEGRHLLTFLIVMEPNQHKLDHDFRIASHFAVDYTSVVTIGGGDTPIPTDHAASVKSRPVSDFLGDPGPVFLTRHPNGAQLWFHEQVAPNRPFQFYIHGSSDTAAEALIVLLANWRQVDIQPGQPVFHARFQPDEKLSIPVSLQTAAPITELMALRLDLPRSNHPRDAMVHSTRRARVDLENTDGDAGADGAGRSDP